MIKIFLIDDHALFRNGIRAFLAGTHHIHIIGESGTGIEGLRLVRELQPDVVLLDIKLPDISGLEVTQRLLCLPQPPKILVLSAVSHHEFPRRILEAGALGYLNKDASMEELVHAIKSVHQNQPIISPTIANSLALARLDPQNHPLFNQLNGKEIEVLMFALRDIPPAEISRRLNMSPKTVHSYRSRLFKKLGVDNNVGLMLLAIREGLVTLEETGI